MRVHQPVNAEKPVIAAYRPEHVTSLAVKELILKHNVVIICLHSISTEYSPI
jgi:hypothetical protein